ncbi:sugar porter family MFS transporter [Humibacter ginsenosidimutans]|uniref:Sugar porter family MFS transporter n=1 Tax=Humibacter ginsenosidimutans TaxID=2599293 RepID=A0A5B8M3B5_9MICO|nr:sugar porter family MFS transporter [Humibacter ginsenosidimutans]QDZ14080.1 sugar porter family MFS transporter [Humibacter ginsenosidimutans]
MTDEHSTDEGRKSGGGAMGSAHRGKVLGVTISAALGGLLFGFDTSVINGAVDSIQHTFDLGSAAIGFTVAITLIGCAIGAWFAGQLADAWGRKPVMVLAAILFVASSIASGLAFADWFLMLWRFIGGLAIGIASVIAPAYIGEIAPAKLRGALSSLQQLAITLGIFLALLSDAALAGSEGNAMRQLWFGLPAWRWMLLVGVIPALVYGILSLSIPESPQFLVRKGRKDEARSVVSEVTGAIDIDRRISEIEESLENASRARYRDLRGTALGLQPILWVGLGMAAFQQLVGINAIFYYSTTLWKSVGFSSSDSFVTSVITSVINVVLTFVAILFVDRVGRKALLLWGSAGMFVGLVLASVSFSQAHMSGKTVTLPEPWGVIALIGANLFVIFFAATWGPVMWVVLGEVFPNRIRGLGLGIAAACNWVFNFLVTLLFPVLSQAVGLGWVYAGFALFAALSFWFVFSALPEVTGLELEDKTKLEHLHRERTA